MTFKIGPILWRLKLAQLSNCSDVNKSKANKQIKINAFELNVFPRRFDINCLCLSFKCLSFIHWNQFAIMKIFFFVWKKKKTPNHMPFNHQMAIKNRKWVVEGVYKMYFLFARPVDMLKQHSMSTAVAWCGATETMSVNWL